MTDLTSFSTHASPNTPPARRPAAWRLSSGLLLIGLGAALLLANRLINAGNWWSIFIFLTAVGLLAGGWPALFSNHPFFKILARASLSAGLLVLSVALIFLLDIDWSIGWTWMVIASGLVLSLNALTRWPAGSVRHAAASLLGWAGLSTTLLGVTFLADRLGVINLVALFGATRWWSAFILLPGLGALLQGFGLYALKGRSAGAATLLGMGVVLCLEAAGEFVGLPVRWAAPLVTILTGLALLLPGLWSN